MLRPETVASLIKFVRQHQKYPALEKEVQAGTVSEHTLSIELDDYIQKHQKPTLQQVLFQFIDEKGESDSAIYQRAGIDRRHFSKIRSNVDYHPKKNTVIALALALELDETETEELLEAAGYALSGNKTGDLVIQFCLEQKIYNVQDVNEALDHFGLPSLTGPK